MAVAPAVAGVSAPSVAATTPRDHVPAARIATVMAGDIAQVAAVPRPTDAEPTSAAGQVSSVATTDVAPPACGESLSRGYTQLAPLSSLPIPVEVH